MITLSKLQQFRVDAASEANIGLVPKGADLDGAAPLVRQIGQKQVKLLDGDRRQTLVDACGSSIENSEQSLIVRSMVLILPSAPCSHNSINSIEGVKNETSYTSSEMSRAVELRGRR